ncbi:MAG: hypothetical protein P8Z37_18170, partial [Acidobacteriota bacterium]
MLKPRLSLIFLVFTVLTTSVSCTPDKSTGPETPEPVLGKSLRYCNPLSIEASSLDGSARGISLG